MDGDEAGCDYCGTVFNLRDHHFDWFGDKLACGDCVEYAMEQEGDTDDDA